MKSGTKEKEEEEDEFNIYDFIITFFWIYFAFRCIVVRQRQFMYDINPQ